MDFSIIAQLVTEGVTFISSKYIAELESELITFPLSFINNVLYVKEDSYPLDYVLKYNWLPVKLSYTPIVVGLSFIPITNFIPSGLNLSWKTYILEICKAFDQRRFISWDSS